VALRLDVPGLQRCEAIVARADLRLPVERYSLAVAKPVDDRDRSVVISAGAVADIDDEAAQVLEVTTDLVQGGGQFSFSDAFQLENPNVTECRRPAVVKHPRRGLLRRSETIAGECLCGRPEQLPDLAIGKFRPESRLFFCGKVSRLPVPGCRDFQLDVPVVQG